MAYHKFYFLLYHYIMYFRFLRNINGLILMLSWYAFIMLYVTVCQTQVRIVLEWHFQSNSVAIQKASNFFDQNWMKHKRQKCSAEI